jgi:hypothetical protein
MTNNFIIDRSVLTHKYSKFLIHIIIIKYPCNIYTIMNSNKNCVSSGFNGMTIGEISRMYRHQCASMLHYMYILYLVIKEIFSWTRSVESVAAVIFNYLLLTKLNPKHTKPEQPIDGPVSREQYELTNDELPLSTAQNVQTMRWSGQNCVRISFNLPWKTFWIMLYVKAHFILKLSLNLQNTMPLYYQYHLHRSPIFTANAKPKRQIHTASVLKCQTKWADNKSVPMS